MDYIYDNQKILISIVSYREHELENTIKEFCMKAKNKYRLYFAVVSQSDKHPGIGFVDMDKIRYLKIDFRDTYGVCWARSIASSMFSSYDYYFQIDGHMYPEKDWDAKLIEKYIKAKESYGNKVILSVSPAAYTLDIQNNERLTKDNRHHYPDISGVHLQKDRWPRLVAMVDDADEEFKQIYYIQGACIFSERSLLDELPIDPEINYFAEELTYAIRAFNAKYKILAFTSPKFYHLFGTEREHAGVHRNPWIDQVPNLQIIDEPARAKEFFRGAIHNKYGVSLDAIHRFCDVAQCSIEGVEK